MCMHLILKVRFAESGIFIRMPDSGPESGARLHLGGHPAAAGRWFIDN